MFGREGSVGGSVGVVVLPTVGLLVGAVGVTVGVVCGNETVGAAIEGGGDGWVGASVGGKVTETEVDLVTSSTTMEASKAVNRKADARIT